MRIWVPRDAAARALGADEVAGALAAEAQRRGIDLTVVRNGSRGMVWLEPLVEVETDGVRIAYGPVAPGDVAALLDGDLAPSAQSRRSPSSPARPASPSPAWASSTRSTSPTTRPTAASRASAARWG
jgi:hypothetical protein